MKTASDFRSIARGALSGHWISAVGTTLLAGILGAEITLTGNGAPLISHFQNYIHKDQPRGTELAFINLPMEFFIAILGIAIVSFLILIVIFIVQFVVGSFVSLGLVQYNLNLIDGKEATVGQIFSKTSIMWKAVCLRIRMNVFIFLWSLLLIIPGIIKYYSYSMSGFILSENPEMTAKEAMEVSIQMMQGNKWRLFCLEFSFIGWGLLCFLSLGIGYLWLNPYINASIAAFYDDVSRESVGTFQ